MLVNACFESGFEPFRLLEGNDRIGQTFAFTKGSGEPDNVALVHIDRIGTRQVAG